MIVILLTKVGPLSTTSCSKEHQPKGERSLYQEVVNLIGQSVLLGGAIPQTTQSHNGGCIFSCGLSLLACEARLAAYESADVYARVQIDIALSTETVG